MRMDLCMIIYKPIHWMQLICYDWPIHPFLVLPFYTQKYLEQKVHPSLNPFTTKLDWNCLSVIYLKTKKSVLLAFYRSALSSTLWLRCFFFFFFFWNWKIMLFSAMSLKLKWNLMRALVSQWKGNGYHNGLTQVVHILYHYLINVKWW